jgi:hypothetical protein
LKLPFSCPYLPSSCNCKCVPPCPASINVLEIYHVEQLSIFKDTFSLLLRQDHCELYTHHLVKYEQLYFGWWEHVYSSYQEQFLQSRQFL